MAEPSAPSESSGQDGAPTVKPAAAADPTDETVAATAETPRRRWLGFPSLRTIGLLPLILIGLLLVYYIGGMLWLTNVDDDVEFGLPSTAPEGGSLAVAVAADLIDREVNTHRWVGNDPFFLPGSMLDNMPNYQQGIITALFRFASELRDEIARTRGSSAEDADAKAIASYLAYEGDIWIFDFKTSWAPTAPSENRYREGMNALRRFNTRLESGDAMFEARADNLQTTIDKFTSDIGSASAAIERHLRDRSGWLPDFQADDLFYANKGRLYAYYLLMRALREDFSKVITEKDLGNAWRLTLES
ncbi:MAG: DUF2333 family protein, partial [Geminicoccaceae bacterium]